ncbi:hypothetical protein CVT25_015307 [Psilocybe cyanescens]|uniref:Peptidase A1 domain-containing protein n=1 Tax=Psilocybe cyanescens TaxID=93625 RepID=A0A409WH26_PSICY|nr:hypothetical protein CVT25_015307 [Psilocybe cyanescens]
MLSCFFFLALLFGNVCLAQNNVSPVNTPIQKFYSSNFVNPSPPNITSEFRANYMQHKFDINVNNIVTGFMYLSPSQQKVRADGAADGSLEVSMFDFKNTTANGTQVANSILSFVGGATDPICSSFFLEPFVLLFPEDFLSQFNAVYAGVQHDDLYGPVTAWTFSRGDNLQVTFFLDTTNTLVRYDFAASDTLRTFATTRFFNIIPGPINSTVFETSCQ